MKYLFLWLEGALQSWGADSRFNSRRTLEFPTKSGIYGLLLAASGDSGPQEELLARMADAPLSVLTFQNDQKKLNDYHMVGAGYNRKDKWENRHEPKLPNGQDRNSPGGGIKQTYREYLQNSCFAAVLGLPDELAEKFAAALQNPVYDLYLGRKCCVPSEMIYQGMFSTETEAFEAVNAMIARKNADASRTAPLIPLDLIQEIKTPEDLSVVELLNDVPLRFGTNKLYRDRWIIHAEYPFGTN